MSPLFMPMAVVYAAFLPPVPPMDNPDGNGDDTGMSA